MSGNSEPVAVETKTIAPLSHRRILWTMAIIVLSVSVLLAALVSSAFGAGFLIGGILSFINYYWLKIALKKIFEAAAGGEKPSFLSGSYFLRYLALAAAIFIVYQTDVVPIVAVLLGLCVFAAAVFIEGLIRIFNTNTSKREEI